jgi:hypothetical protein
MPVECTPIVRLLLLAGSLFWVSLAGPATSASAQAAARPPLGDFEPRLRLLFEAIVQDKPALAADVFFPRDAFLQVKAMQNPGRYWDRLRARFELDIHALHKSVGDLKQARYERFELSKRGGLVAPGDEGNALSYWASRHSFLHYRVGAQLRKLEVRVAITWQSRWYVIHLSEFH